MNVLFKCFAVASAVCALSAGAHGQRGGSRRGGSASSSQTSANTVSIEQTKEDCATKFMAALDMECFNNRSDGGVYSDCSDKSIVELYDAMDMNLGRLVPYAELAATVKTCAPYKGHAIEKWLSAKRVVEVSAVKDSDECVFAKQKLAAAANCYSAALAHDGNFFEFESLMKRSCGQYQDVAQKFARAGDLGLANLPRMLENWSTMQFTNKAENWRSQIEAVFVGYMYRAKLACNVEDYELIELNQFQPDVRENLLTLVRRGFADQLGRQGARGIHGTVLIGAPAGYNAAKTKEDKNEEFYASMGWRDAVTGRLPTGGAKRGKEPYSVGNVYTVDGVANLGAARARLIAIVQNGSIGTAATQDELDAKIIVSLGGRAGGDSGIYNIISSMKDGDTFIMRQADGTCQAMRLKDKVLVRITNAEMDNMPSLYGYMGGCRELIE